MATLFAHSRLFLSSQRMSARMPPHPTRAGSATVADSRVGCVRGPTPNAWSACTNTAARRVVRHGVGLDKVDVPDGRRPGIAVDNVPDDSHDEISNHASAPLAAVHHLPPGSTAPRVGGDGIPPIDAISRLADRTPGLVRLERIGQRVAGKAGAFDTRVVHLDRYDGCGLRRSSGPRPRARASDRRRRRTRPLKAHPLIAGHIDEQPPGSKEAQLVAADDDELGSPVRRISGL